MGFRRPGNIKFAMRSNGFSGNNAQRPGVKPYEIELTWVNVSQKVTCVDHSEIGSATIVSGCKKV